MSAPDVIEFDRRRAEPRHAHSEQVLLRRRIAVISLAATLAAGAVLATGAFAPTGGVRTVHVLVTSPLPAKLPVEVTIKVPAPRASTGGTPSGSSSPAAGATGPTLPATATTTGVLKSGAASSFLALQRELAGPVGVAAVGVGSGSEVVLGNNARAPAWSTSKVPVLVGLLKATHGVLNTTELQEAQLAITESDNQSILDLFGDLEQLKGGLDGASAYITKLFRESGDDSTVVTTAPPPPDAVTTFGQTEWSPGEAVKFYRAFAAGCLLPASQTNYVLHLMQHIVSYESWGLGSAGFKAVAFKGGWGPQNNGAYLVRQSGIVDPSTSEAIAITIVAHPPPGADSFTVGTQMVTETAQWLAHELILTPRTGAPCA